MTLPHGRAVRSSTCGAAKLPALPLLARLTSCSTLCMCSQQVQEHRHIAVPGGAPSSTLALDWPALMVSLAKHGALYGCLGTQLADLAASHTRVRAGAGPPTCVSRVLVCVRARVEHLHTRAEQGCMAV